MPKKKESEAERILLYNNFARRNEVERRLNSVISIANETVIPICKALGMPLLKPALLKWVADDEEFLADYVSKCKRDFAEQGGFVGRLLTEAAESDFTTQKKFYPYPVFPYCRTLTANEEKLITLKGDVMSYSEEKLTEFTNVYLTGEKQIEGYRRAEERCRFLNDFFSGTQLSPTRDTLSNWSRVVFTTPDGEFLVSPRQDFTKLIKNQ